MTGYYDLGLTGRDRVSHAFGGGLPEGGLVLFEGPDGAGKSVMCQRFTYGFLEEGYDVTYVSTELDAGGFVKQMASLTYDVKPHLLYNNLQFFAADVDTHTVDTEGRAFGERELISKLKDAPHMWRSNVVILDEFGAMMRNDPVFDASAEQGDEDHAIQSLLSFFEQMQNQGVTIILTVAPGDVSEKALRPLRDKATQYFQIETQQVGQDIQHSIAVRRFLDMEEPVEDSIGFSVKQGRGVVIERRTVA